MQTAGAALAAMLLVAGCARTAGVPPVAVVRGDLPGGADALTSEPSASRYRAVCDALDAAGIPYEETCDTTVESAGLPDVQVAIMPCSPAVSDGELAHLRAFLRRPARLIVFDTCPDALAADLGAALGPILRDDGAGSFYAMHRTRDAVLGLPNEIALEAPEVRELHPIGAEPLCIWHSLSGRSSEVTALVLSERGAIVGAPPQGERVSQLTLLLRALIGHFVPDTWAALAPHDPASIGPVGHYASLADFGAVLARASGDYLDGARADAHEANELLAAVPGLLEQGWQEEAIAASRNAQQLAQRAWFRSYPSYSPEIRGVWAADTVDGGWRQAIENLARSNFNTVFPYMASGAAAWYPSRVLPRAGDASGDPLAEAIRWGREHGVRVHPRILALSTMGAPAELKQQLKEQGRIARSPSGPDMHWLCPSRHENRRQIIQTALEMVTTYGADGVQFDYLRYSWKDRCVCDHCRERFVTETGATVKNWPEDVLAGSLKAAFLQWRREQITSLLRTVRQKMKQVRPDAALSAAVFMNWEGHRDSFGQDWKAWIDEGLVDFVCPMTYISDMAEFQSWVRKQEAWAAGKVPVAMGIGPFADIDERITPQGVLDQIQASRRLGCEGFVLFNYRRELAQRYLPLLALGATSTPAQMPTQARR